MNDRTKMLFSIITHKALVAVNRAAAELKVQFEQLEIQLESAKAVNRTLSSERSTFLHRVNCALVGPRRGATLENTLINELRRSLEREAVFRRVLEQYRNGDLRIDEQTLELLLIGNDDVYSMWEDLPVELAVLRDGVVVRVGDWVMPQMAQPWELDSGIEIVRIYRTPSAGVRISCAIQPDGLGDFGPDELEFHHHAKEESDGKGNDHPSEEIRQ